MTVNDVLEFFINRFPDIYVCINHRGWISLNKLYFSDSSILDDEIISFRFYKDMYGEDRIKRSVIYFEI